VDRIRDTVAATRSALRRTVTVTPVFEAVTAGCWNPGVRLVEALFQLAIWQVGSCRQRGSRGGDQTRTKEIGFQVLAVRLRRCLVR